MYECDSTPQTQASTYMPPLLAVHLIVHRPIKAYCVRTRGTAINGTCQQCDASLAVDRSAGVFVRSRYLGCMLRVVHLFRCVQKRTSNTTVRVGLISAHLGGGHSIARIMYPVLQALATDDGVEMHIMTPTEIPAGRQCRACYQQQVIVVRDSSCIATAGKRVSNV